VTGPRLVAVPGRLPRGRHGLSREAVVDSQRERVLDAMIAAVNEDGYHATSIVEVAHRAGVSRKTVYEVFADKEGCLLAAHDLLVGRLLAAVRPAWERPGAWSEKVRGALAAILTAIADRPQGARLALVEMLAAGRASELPDLQGELVRLVLLPYLGPEHVLKDTRTAGGAAKGCGPRRDSRAAGWH
jgi:AcrR family transcriptional regulator